MNVQKQYIVPSLLLYLYLFTAPVNAQSPEDLTQTRLQPDSRLYNGHQYIRNGSYAIGFPFFQADSLQSGSFVYDGICYQDMTLEYDLVLDQLIIPDYARDGLISLITEKVTRFSIGSHLFEYFIKSDAGLPQTGFYEVLYAGSKVSLLARRQKRFIFPSDPETPKRYDAIDQYFLRTENKFRQISGQSSLLAALPDKAVQVKKYIRKNRVRFKKELEKDLLQTTAYYQQIRP